MSRLPLRQVTVVGLGLIGGSIAKALRQLNPDLTILAVDCKIPSLEQSASSVVSQWITTDEVPQARELISQSDLVVLCQPVHVIAQSLRDYVLAGCVVTDTGSTKRHIISRAESLEGAAWFVPSHPMAGKEVGGFANSSADLFTGRPWIVCPQGRHPDAVSRVESLVDALGAQRITMTAEQHDAAVALTSHLPQLLASWLKVAGTELGVLGAAGPAFADMTRVAGGAEGIWRDIFETNADEVGRILQESALALAALSDALLATPPRIERVLQVLARARAARTRP